MSTWTSERSSLHPVGPAVAKTIRVPEGTVTTQTTMPLKVSDQRVLSRDTSFKLYKRRLEEGQLSSLSASQKRLLASWDFGSKFTLEHMTREPVSAFVRSAREVSFQGKGNLYTFEGPWFVGISDDNMSKLVRTNASWPTFGPTEDAELFAQGGTAIKRTTPTQATVNLAVSLAELLREGVPSMVGSQLRAQGLNTRALGGEYLNIEFGWAPLIRDIHAVLDTVRRSTELLREFHERSGQHIRRRYDFEEQRSVDSFQGPNIYGSPGASAYLLNKASAYPQVVRTMTTRTWFSGAYRYFLPYGDDLLSKARQWEADANHLMGIRITPEVLWNMTPWTWLSDWFVSFGDVVSNVSHIGQDGLTLHYGYIMRTTTLEAEVSLPGVSLRSGSPDVSERVTLTRKVRRRASPYGFGITPEALTPKQWSILGALGATRAPGIGFNHVIP